ncbi:D-Ala-D-Ala carboxypeptidase family metallohydrolase [Sorangium sp. So ce1036]|uniref:YcbK family protein n=1 Tax=Sorangium sp. So ce1036 TaxID=3133328 RepID=UPI003F0A82F9
MPATSRTAAQPLAALLGLTAALLAAPPPAGASLLDEPPRRATFDLNETVAPELPLLRAFRNAAIERPGPLRLYMSSAYGKWQHQPWWQLAWGGARAHADDADDALGERGLAAAAALGAPAFASAHAPLSPLALPGTLHLDPAAPTWLNPTWLKRLDPGFTPPPLETTGPSLLSNGFDLLWDPPKQQPPSPHCQRGPVQFARYGGEHDAFELVRCDGSVAPGALDRLSILARPPEAPDPGELLPDEPDEGTWQRALEWVPHVRLVHPRLLWALQQIADAFPRRGIYLYSGYRPRPSGDSPRARGKRSGGHHSQHAEGRAVDIAVRGVPNAALFRFCRTLSDVACGFYPNSKFVHVDVRRPGTGRLFWIDASGPGEPSRYVDAWPGVVERGGLSWGAQGSPSGASSSR